MASRFYRGAFSNIDGPDEWQAGPDGDEPFPLNSGDVWGGATVVTGTEKDSYASIDFSWMWRSGLVAGVAPEPALPQRILSRELRSDETPAWVRSGAFAEQAPQQLVARYILSSQPESENIISWTRQPFALQVIVGRYTTASPQTSEQSTSFVRGSSPVVVAGEELHSGRILGIPQRPDFNESFARGYAPQEAQAEQLFSGRAFSIPSELVEQSLSWVRAGEIEQEEAVSLQLRYTLSQPQEDRTVYPWLFKGEPRPESSPYGSTSIVTGTAYDHYASLSLSWLRSATVEQPIAEVLRYGRIMTLSEAQLGGFDQVSVATRNSLRFVPPVAPGDIQKVHVMIGMLSMRQR